MPSKYLQMYLFTLSVLAPLKAGMPFTTCNRIGKISLLSNRLFRYSSVFALFLCLFYVSALLHVWRLSLNAACGRRGAVLH